MYPCHTDFWSFSIFHYLEYQLRLNRQYWPHLIPSDSFVILVPSQQFSVMLSLLLKETLILIYIVLLRQNKTHMFKKQLKKLKKFRLNYCIQNVMILQLIWCNSNISSSHNFRCCFPMILEKRYFPWCHIVSSCVPFKFLEELVFNVSRELKTSLHNCFFRKAQRSQC